tara:strand:- start:329 stop:805 length:477 start_codon:yes stop_codon:yes gene_type:complete
MSLLTRFKFFLWYFGHFQVPLIGTTHPQLMELTNQEVVVKIKLRRKTKNHLNSMYFGALSIGADIAGGLHGFYHIKQANVKASLIFKSFEAEFLSRPESDVYFVCRDGLIVQDMISKSKANHLRVNQMIHIEAYTMFDNEIKKKCVARFKLELSIKVL